MVKLKSQRHSDNKYKFIRLGFLTDSLKSKIFIRGCRKINKWNFNDLRKNNLQCLASRYTRHEYMSSVSHEIHPCILSVLSIEQMSHASSVQARYNISIFNGIHPPPDSLFIYIFLFF